MSRPTLGKVQRAALLKLNRVKAWNPAIPAFLWGTPSGTAMVLDSLATRGLALRDDKAGNGVLAMYRITPAGEAEATQ